MAQLEPLIRLANGYQASQVGPSDITLPFHSLNSSTSPTPLQYLSHLSIPLTLTSHTKHIPTTCHI